MRRKPKPDTRPHWNDADLKVPYAGRLYSADDYQKLCVIAVERDRTPHWTKDPTYNLKKDKK